MTISSERTPVPEKLKQAIAALKQKQQKQRKTIDIPSATPEELTAKAKELNLEAPFDTASPPQPKALQTATGFDPQIKLAPIDTEEKRKAIVWVQQQGLPLLPVAPAFPATKYCQRHKNGKPKKDKSGNLIPLFNGKNPSYLDRNGKPRIIKHQLYQLKRPTHQEIARWFQHPATGMGTLGGWNDTKFIDIDAKNFGTQEECDKAANEIFSRCGAMGLFEKSQSGGYHIAVKNCENVPSKFSLSPEGKIAGELIGKGLFVVLAPTGGKYESLKRSPDVPIVEKLEDIGIYPITPVKQPKEYHQRLRRPENGLDRFVRFPADLWQHYRAPLTLWLLARYFDIKGSGWSEFQIETAALLCQRKTTTIRAWLAEGIRSGLFRRYTTKAGRIKIFYTSLHRLAAAAKLSNLGAIALIDLETDIKNLRIVATEAIQSDLQKASRYAAYREEKQLAEEQQRNPIKPSKPEKLVLPCEKNEPRVLWTTLTDLGVSEGCVDYGSSQEAIAERRHLSSRQIRRHLSNCYRLEPSPVRGYRKDLPKHHQKQLHQRLPYRVKRTFLAVVQRVEDVDENKFYVDKFGRVWERKCNIAAPRHQLVRCRLRRSRLQSMAETTVQQDLGLLTSLNI